MSTLTISDLQPINGEPRVRDLTLAERLGMSRPRDIRANLIRPNLSELLTYGGLRETNANPGAQGGRPSVAFWLNEPQALLICMFSRTPLAAEVRKQVIEVFMAWRQGTVHVRKHHRRPPQPKAANPLDAKVIESTLFRQRFAGGPWELQVVGPFDAVFPLADMVFTRRLPAI